MSANRKASCIVALASIFAVGLGTAATAATPLQRSFDAMIARPNDPDLTLAYSRQAVAVGDYESAIPPLERLLMNNPAQPEIRLEIGVLYYLLDSKSVARGYLADVAADPKATADTAGRARSYLAKL